MSHPIRTFRATTADEALAQVRRELGVDAVVVEVKQVARGGLFGWLSSRQTFEVTASRARPALPSAKPTAAPGIKNGPTIQGTIAAAAARRSVSRQVDNAAEAISADVPKSKSQNKPSSEGLAPPPPLLPEIKPNGNRLGDVVSPRHSRPSRDEVTRNLVADIVRNLPAAQGGTVAYRTTETVSERPSRMSSFEAAPGLLPGVAPATSLTIEQRLDALQQMIADLGQRTPSQGLAEIPPDLFPHYLNLIESDVDEGLARELIQLVQRHTPTVSIAGTPEVRTTSATALLTALIEQRIPCDRAIVPRSGCRQIVMVVGPTGVGKTTTLAKLAGRFGVQDNCRLGLITVDTYRVAAVEQLKTYAEIIDLPMRIVGNAAEMHEALDAFANFDLVLIDTAGRSPHDDHKLMELNQLVEAACPDHIYLVLSLASGSNALRTAAERFSTIRPTSVVFTKLDEATGCGGLLSAAREIGLPISYFTTGQEVPRDIEPANPCRAARLIVGTDTLNHSLA